MKALVLIFIISNFIGLQFRAGRYKIPAQQLGVDYIGISGDYDGIDFTIDGMEDVSCYPNLLVELARRGWTKEELSKITGENFLRVFEEVEEKARLR